MAYPKNVGIKAMEIYFPAQVCNPHPSPLFLFILRPRLDLHICPVP